MKKLVLALAVLVVVSPLSGGLPLRAAEPPPTAGSAAAGDEAMAIMDRMASFLAKAENFSVKIRTGYDAVQGSGERIEFGERRSVVVARPDRFRVEVERSDGERILLLFDGKEITAFLGEQDVYAQVNHPGSIDDAVVFVVRELQTRVPLSLLLSSHLPAELARRVETAAYVERSQLTAIPTDHIAARTAEVDFQMWIAAEGDPLLYRVVITYKNAPGQPQFRADFSDWDLSPDVSPDQFSFSPPTGAERIPFMARVRGSGDVQ